MSETKVPPFELVVLNESPPIFTNTRIDSDFGCSTTGRYNDSHSSTMVAKPRAEDYKLFNHHVETLAELQHRLWKRSTKDGLTTWGIGNDLASNAYGSFHLGEELTCPICGGENIHQVKIIAPNPNELITIVYQCESCIGEPHLHIAQHKGISSIYFDAEMILKDFGIYDYCVKSQENRSRIAQARQEQKLAKRKLLKA